MNLIFKFCPKQFNHRLAAESIVAVNQDCSLIAFSTKEHEVILFSKNNNRTFDLGKCNQLISNIVFTNSDLLIAEEGSHQLFVFSLKNFKLKKKLVSHRSKIIKVQYNSNRNLILTQSKQTCILWNSVTYTKQKTLNCSTSFFTDSSFTPNGQYLINLFDDTSVFYWTLDTYESFQCKIINTKGKIKLAAQNNKYVAVYSQKQLYLSDFAYQRGVFHKIFDFNEEIKKIKFFNKKLLILTNSNLMMAHIRQDFKIQLDIKKISTQLTRDFNTNYSHDFITFLTNSYDVFVGILEQEFPTQKINIQNPLKNVNNYCAGGFNNEKGCNNLNMLPKVNYYPVNQQRLEKIYKSSMISKEDLKDFSRPKLGAFLKRNFRFADKHRAISYKYLLDLPSNVSEFKQLMRKGIHESTRLLKAKYPIKNEQLLDKMTTIISLLAHFSPIFAEADNIPSLVFPFVSIFGQDELLCFEIVSKFLIHYMQFFYEKFPLANNEIIQNIQEVINKIDSKIITHFQQKNLSLAKLIWQLMSNCFSDVLSRQNYLTILDHLVCSRQTPQLLLFFVISYIIYNKSTILNLKNDEELEIFLNNQNNIQIAKYLTLTDRLFNQFRHLIRYKYQKIDWKSHQYGYFDKFPKEAVQIYKQKRYAQQKDYQYDLENQRFKDIISQKLNVVAVEEKIKIESEAILAEAHKLRFEKQQKNVVNIKKGDEKKRVERLHNLVQLMKQNINIQETISKNINELPLTVPAKQRQINDDQLDKLQNKLIKIMMNKSPQPIISHLLQPIMPVEKAKQTQLLKSMLNIQLIEGMRRINEVQKKNQEKKWQNQLIKVYNNFRG